MTSDLLQVLKKHQPIPMLSDVGQHTQYLACQGRGCFFITYGDHLMWDEFAQHQHDMVRLEGAR